MIHVSGFLVFHNSEIVIVIVIVVVAVVIVVVIVVIAVIIVVVRFAYYNESRMKRVQVLLVASKLVLKSFCVCFVVPSGGMLHSLRRFVQDIRVTVSIYS